MFRKDTLIMQGRVIFTRCSNYEPPPVQQALTNNLKGFKQSRKSNQNNIKTALCGVYGGENEHIKTITESNLCVVVLVINTLLKESPSIAHWAHLFGPFAEKWLPNGKYFSHRKTCKSL